MTTPTIRGDINLHAACRYTIASGLEAGSANVASVLEDAPGDFEVTLGTAIAIADAAYSVQIEGSVVAFATVLPVSETFLRVQCYDAAGAFVNPTAWSLVVRRFNVIG